MLILLALSCTPTPSDTDPAPKIERAVFNAHPAVRDASIFWSTDTKNPGVIDPTEVAVAWGPRRVNADQYVLETGFTLAFEELWTVAMRVPSLPEGPEGLRRKAVLSELEQGRPTLVSSDLTDLSENQKRAVAFLLDAALVIEKLYGLQNGIEGLVDRIPPDDPISRVAFQRNQGPWCTAPTTLGNPHCKAIPEAPARKSGLYPEAIQTPGFCDTLSETLLQPFGVVTQSAEGTLKAVPFTEHWKVETAMVAQLLRYAEDALGDEEPALRSYLAAAAGAFETNDWFAADTAWAAMNARNSGWYLRVGPDETYFEPCNRKAGFHLVLARINPDSLQWQDRLEPVKQDLENALAALAGAPYASRRVAFDLPDFIDIVVNAGDSRNARGATIGQSLPNWGPVAEAGGRTVAMTNLFTDPDSLAIRRVQAESLFCEDFFAHWTDKPEPMLTSTILHEAAHNLGPAHGYTVDGQTDEARFGGGLASMLEEHKAQASALYLTDFLVEKGILEAEFARQAHVADLVWAMGKIASGLETPDGHPEAYGQLAAIELESFLAAGAITWKANEAAANGTDIGCFSVDHQSLPGAIRDLTQEVLQIKSQGDQDRAIAMRTRALDAPGARERRALIEQRWHRHPEPSFYYDVRLE